MPSSARTETESATGRRRPARPALAAAAAGLLLVGLTACGGDDDDDAATDDTQADTGDTAAGGAEGATTYEVTSIAYTDVEAPAGGTLEIVNDSGAGHTFTADDGEFDVSYGSGESATVDVPSEPGSYGFHCEIHPSMSATLTAQ
jgi:plastocyanin